jgi:hypothetical protein
MRTGHSISRRGDSMSDSHGCTYKGADTASRKLPRKLSFVSPRTKWPVLMAETVTERQVRGRKEQNEQGTGERCEEMVHGLEN